MADGAIRDPSDPSDPSDAGDSGDGTGRAEGPVRLERRGPVAVVTLDSPHNRNALSSAMLSELRALLRGVQGDPEVRAVVLTGTGSVFCSGADLRERRLAGAAGPGGTGGARREDGGDTPGGIPAPSLPDVLACLAELPQPVVARVNGHVRAGGMGLVAACDLAVAPRGATFALSEVRVGVAPAMIAVPALRVMDRRSFARYALTGDPFGADEAVTAGLLTAAVEPDELDGWVDRAVASVLQGAPMALAATKGLIEALGGTDWEASMVSAEALSEELFASADAAEGMSAFLEKRPPSWAAERGRS